MPVIALATMSRTWPLRAGGGLHHQTPALAPTTARERRKLLAHPGACPSGKDKGSDASYTASRPPCSLDMLSGGRGCRGAWSCAGHSRRRLWRVS